MDQTYSIDASVLEARRWLGVRWGHRQRGPRRIDCLGLIIKAVEAGGIAMRDRLDYGRHPWHDGLERELIAHFGEGYAPADMQNGDIALMIGEGQPAPGHVGIVATNEHGHLHLIHSYNATSNSVVVEHYIDDLWLSRIVKVFRP